MQNASKQRRAFAQAQYDGLSFEEIDALSHGRLDVKTTCPLCSANRSTAEKRKRKVFRIWRKDENFLTFYCIHCGEKGWLRRGNSIPVDFNRLHELRRESEKLEREERLRRMGKARALWSFSRDIRGTLAERYFREVRGIRYKLPATIRFLPASRPEYFPAAVAAYGLPIEPEPGRLHIEDIAVKAIQLTLLAPDGTKAQNEAGLSKIAVGPSLGFPIVVAPPNDELALAIAEGVENALNAYEGAGMGAWASTGAKKLEALAPVIPSYIESLTICADDDADGRAGAAALIAALAGRDIEIWTEFTPSKRVAA
jgi:hypothetical protein